MPLYLMLGKLNAAGKHAGAENPDQLLDRIQATPERGAIYAKLITLGRYDFAVVVQATGNEAAARLSQEISAVIGADIETLPAMRHRLDPAPPPAGVAIGTVRTARPPGLESATQVHVAHEANPDEANQEQEEVAAPAVARSETET